MKSFRYEIPFLRKIDNVLKTFSLTEKIVFGVLVIVFLSSVFYMFAKAYGTLLVEVPEKGGTLKEGVLGTPRFINPVLALSDADRDMIALVYSGLMKAQPDGTLVNDLAESYSISDDGLNYTFTLKPDLVFHDGEPITSEDVVFTINRAKDPAIKSPRKSTWDGVTVEAIGQKQVKFTLPQPYAPFLENATMGILPKNVWKNITAEEFSFSEYNTKPVGSGPFEVSDIKKDSTGSPYQFTLKPFDNHAGHEPYLKKIIVYTFGTIEKLKSAMLNGSIDSSFAPSSSVAKELYDAGINYTKSTSPRIFSVFFNQNQNELFLELEVREALDVAIDRDQIVSSVLNGFGTTLYGPLSQDILDDRTIYSDIDMFTSSESRILRAQQILENAKWTKNEETGVYEKKKGTKTLSLAFSISTSDVPDLKATAEIVKSMWQKVGADVEVKIYESGDLNQNILRPRKYDSLLFGEIVGRDLDLFPFWHSSQRNDPGLNIAQYANIKTDKLLEDIRTDQDFKNKLDSVQKVLKEIHNDHPAVFLYSPDFIYFVPKDIKNIETGHITIPAERFLNVNEWYKYTNKILSIFNN